MLKLSKNSKRLVIAVILGVLTICFAVVGLLFKDNKVFACGDAEIVTQGNLVDNSVLIVLDENISGINKKHSSGFFKGVEIDKIVDLTKRKTNKDNKDKSFRQILQIYIKQGSEREVVKAAEKLRKIDGIISAEPNYAVEVNSVSANDYLANQWNLNETNGINAVGAWDITTGSKSVRVGIIDTGIANHPDLNGNLETGYDYYNNNTVTTDDEDNHGTKVAGIIGAVGNNGQGVAGINWNVKMVPLQVSYYNEQDGEIYCSLASVVKAIEDATEKWGTNEQIDILNYSVAGFGLRSQVLSAVKNFKGLFVWSAGNNGENVDSFANIADYNLPNLISVGAIDKNGNRSVWSSSRSSNYGRYVNIFAPGGETFSSNDVPTTNNNGGISTFDGTSAAAPHVTGVAALMLAENPNLTAAQLKELILKGADTINISVPNSSGGTTTQSVKKLNAYKAVKYVDNADSNHLVFLETTNNPEGTQPSTQSLWVSNGGYWPSTVNVPEAPFGYEFSGYHYTTDYSTDDKFKIYYENGAFNNNNYYFSRNYVNLSSDITLQSRWMPKSYYFTVSIRHSANWENPETVIATTRTYEESLTHGMSNTYSSNGVNKGFTRWEIVIQEKTIQFSTTPTLNVTVKEIIDNYCPDYEERGNPNIYFYAIYDTNISSGGGKCIAPGSLITLADGTQKPVEELTGTEMLLTWDMRTGSFASAPILFIDADLATQCKLINLSFSDGTAVEVIYEHAFWDCNLNEYVFMREDAAQYVGHWFNKQTTDEDGSLIWTSVQLTGVTVTEEYSAAYSPVTYGYLGYYVNGMLTMPGATEGLINIFEVDGSTMTYDQEAYESDIQTYGLFTHEEFCDILPVSEEVFNAFNGQYLKVVIGKGLLTENDLCALYARYSEFFN